MSTVLLTVIITFVIVAIALAFMAIGWLVTGKAKIQPGACGRNPHLKRDEKDGCGTDVSCQLCEKNDNKEKKDAKLQ